MGSSKNPYWMQVEISCRHDDSDEIIATMEAAGWSKDSNMNGVLDGEYISFFMFKRRVNSMAEETKAKEDNNG